MQKTYEERPQLPALYSVPYCCANFTYISSSLMLLCGVDASFMQKCYVFITYMMGDGGCLKLTKVLLLTPTMVEWDCLLIERNTSSVWALIFAGYY